jgi:hypothetical protein
VNEQGRSLPGEKSLGLKPFIFEPAYRGLKPAATPDKQLRRLFRSLLTLEVVVLKERISS